MSAVVNPVGPQPSSVYWRRRLLLLVVVMVPLLLILALCSGGGDVPTANPVPSTPPTTAVTPSASPSPSATARPSGSATASASSSTAAGGECSDTDIAVSTVVADEQYPVGGPVPIRFAVRNTSDTPCLRDIGALQNTITIRSEGRRIWSSDDCTPGGNPDVRTLTPDSAFTVTVRWQGDVSRPDCASVRPKAPSGNYEVTGRNGSVTGPPDSFTLG